MATDERVKRLADQYILGTADQVPRPKPKQLPAEPAPYRPPGRVRWSDERKEFFKKWGIAALYVAGPDAPIPKPPRHIGDNSLWGWPLRIGTTGKTFADTVTATADSWAAYHWQGVWFRTWVPTPAHARRLAFLVVNALLPDDGKTPAEGTIEGEITRWVRAEKARKSWIDVGPDFDLKIEDDAIERDLGLRPMPPGAPDEHVRERRFKVVRRKLELAILNLAAENTIETWTDFGVVRQLEAWERQAMWRDVEMRGHDE